MRKFSVILVVMACFGLVLGACGDDNGGPTCQDPPACASCDYAGGEVCCDDACQDAVACEPVACDPGVTMCDGCTGDCVDIPETCDPVCGADEHCEGTTCVANECVPACTVKQEACVDGACVACDPVCTGDQFCAE